MKKNIKIQKCGGLIIDSKFNRILCVLNKQSYLKGENKWGFPKGHIQNNEDYKKCAQREIQEETSIYFGLTKFKKYIKLNNNIYYLIQLKSPLEIFKSKDTDEIINVEWKKLDALRHHNFNSDVRKFFHKIKKMDLRTFYYQDNRKKNN